MLSGISSILVGSLEGEFWQGGDHEEAYYHAWLKNILELFRIDSQMIGVL
jgi:hypothetical protein